MVILFVLGVMIAFAGALCGLLAVFRLQEVQHRLTRIERELAGILLGRHREQRRTAASSEHEPPAPQPERPAQQEPVELQTSPAPASEKDPSEPAESPPFQPPPSAQRSPAEPVTILREQLSSFEITVGSKWLNWVGVVFVTIGVLFFLKFAYDNQWIGPRGRIAVGVIAGVASLLIGDKARRRGYPILFQTLTGGGLAAFYGCIYFYVQVYQLTGQTLSFAMLVLVTALALVMAVVHNAPFICFFGQLG
jgi:uncharacterized membrane protein